MIKKYIVDSSSLFHQSLILSLLEKGELGFSIDGLSDLDRRDVLLNKNNTTKIKVVYLDENQSLKALLVISPSKKYYLFKVDHQKENQLNIHQKYISNNADELMDDYEKHLKVKGKNQYDGLGDFKLIKDIDYFDHKYEEVVKNQVSKESSIYRLVFNSNNLFTADFVDLVEKKKIKISNIGQIDKSMFTLLSMGKNKTDRRDCLLIDSETRDIKYLIFTYKPGLVKHFILLKNLGNDVFEFIKETICFNELLACSELKDIKYKKGSALAAKSFAKCRYDNFYSKYVDFEEEEEFDEQVQTIFETIIDPRKAKKDSLFKEVLNDINNYKLPNNVGISLHGKERMIERICDMTDEEMLMLAKVAYHKGTTSVHFLEKDAKMFEFLQYQQGKVQGRTLRLYSGILFFFSLKAPYNLVTCFPFQNSYDTFVKNNKN